MLPSIFGENLFDDFFGDPFGMMPRGRDPLYGKHAKNLMRTDVRETEAAALHSKRIVFKKFRKLQVQVGHLHGRT